MRIVKQIDWLRLLVQTVNIRLSDRPGNSAAERYNVKYI